MKIRELLKNTMLLFADPKAAFLLTQTTERNEKQAETAKQRWSYAFSNKVPLTIGEDQTSRERLNKPLIKGLACRRGKKSFGVATEISFPKVAISRKNVDYELPLESNLGGPDFHLGTFSSTKGKIPANNSHPFWRLEAKTEFSVMAVYGYRVVDGKVTPYPADASWNENYEFFDSPKGAKIKAKRNARDGVGKGGDGTTVDVGKAPDVEVVVAVSFVCCGVSDDFEPSGFLRSCRFYPQINVIANRNLDWIRAKVRLIRPSTSGMSKMKHMDGPMGRGLFTDRNSYEFSRWSPPRWNELFDYYLIDPGKGFKFYAVLEESHLQGKLKNNDTRLSWSSRDDMYKKSSVAKVLRQGAFDNIHIAPRMVYSGKIKMKENKAFMAPVCQHDCLHTHWRWGAEYTSKAFCGFNSRFEPNATAGAPLVPPNQTIALEMLGQSGFEYEALVHQPRKNVLQIVNTHGSTYALEVDSTMNQVLLNLSTTFGADPGDDAWAYFYLNLRYARMKERISYENDYEGLKKLALLGLSDLDQQLERELEGDIPAPLYLTAD